MVNSFLFGLLKIITCWQLIESLPRLFPKLFWGGGWGGVSHPGASPKRSYREARLDTSFFHFLLGQRQEEKLQLGHKGLQCHRSRSEWFFKADLLGPGVGGERGDFWYFLKQLARQEQWYLVDLFLLFLILRVCLFFFFLQNHVFFHLAATARHCCCLEGLSSYELLAIKGCPVLLLTGRSLVSKFLSGPDCSVRYDRSCQKR